MCRSKSVSYFAHDPAHRLLPAAGDGGAGEEFTCGGCLVAGAGPRYRCATPGCGFTIHEACALRFPKSLKSTLHPQHRLKRRAASAAGADGGCDVCGEDVKGACYGCAACGIGVHPLCARMPGVARGNGAGGAHPAEHEAWLVRTSSSTAAAAAAADGGNGEKQVAAAAGGCAACGRAVGAWRYRCVTATCGAEFHPRCLMPAAEQCRGGEGEKESVGKGCCCGMVHYVTYCLAVSSFGYYYRF
ncbi:unnamed protein product [Urochloa decumbens]|uniref:DC1 domain-containing protein n=1 Tax=Urochloa decumbens TaxID=240449 RepID=A0ABC9AT27_9POAL